MRWVLCLLLACNGASPGDESSDTDDSGSDSGLPVNCGNGVVDEAEQCDGADLGGAACGDLGPPYVGGTLSCAPTCTFDATACEADPAAPLVRLNEITSDAVAAGPFVNGASDAIELANAGGGEADLSGWRLSDDPDFPVERTYVFPDGTMLGPGEFLVLTAVDENTMLGDYPFGISDSSVETITLSYPGGDVVDRLPLDGYRAVVSFCRIPDVRGPWTFCAQTFGAANVPAMTACGNGVADEGEQCDGADLAGATCPSLGLGYSGGLLGCTGACTLDARLCRTANSLRINELEAVDDQIELWNGGGAAVDLSGYVLTDDPITAAYDPAADDAELVFAPGTTLGPGEYLVIPPGLAVGQHPFGLGMEGDTVALVGLSPLTVVDQVTYADGEAQISYCRMPDGGDWTDGCTPTFGAAN